MVTEGFQPTKTAVHLMVDEPLYFPGEELVWELSLHNIVGGEATMAVGGAGVHDGKRVVVVQSRVESTGPVKLIKEVRDEVTTWINMNGSSPAFHRANLRFGKKDTYVETKFSPRSFRMRYKRRGRPFRTHSLTLPTNATAHDFHSALAALRKWRADDGDHVFLYVLSGRRMWKNTVRVVGRETIKTQMGVFRAIRLEGTARRLDLRLAVDPYKKARSFVAWFSDDDSRRPLRVLARTEYGNVKAELVHYDRPSHRVATTR